MKDLFAAFLALFAGSVWGQQCPAVNTVPFVPLTRAEAPAPFGDIKDLHFAWSGGGVLLWRYTADGRLYFNAIPLSSFSSVEIGSALLDWGTALSAGTIDAFNAALAAHTTLDMNAPELQAIWCPMWQTMLAGKPAPLPAPVVYVVATNGTTLTRPTYPGDPAALTVNTSKALTARAPVGAVCTPPAFKSGTSSTLYMAFTGGPDAKTVTVCVKKP